MMERYIGEALTSIMRIVGSAIDGPHSAVLMGGEGSVGSIGDDESLGESTQDAEAWGGPGIVWRPRPPEEVSTDGGAQTLGAEAIGLRVGEELRPIGWRDLRWHRRFPAPAPGTIGLVGYGGGFFSLDDAPDGGGDGSLMTLYCPYDFSGGTPGKAMAITMDPDQGAMMLVHGDGFAVILDETGITMRGDGSTWAKLGAGTFEVVANTIQLRGNVALGANTTAAIPLMPGVASQPTPSVFFSPT